MNKKGFTLIELLIVVVIIGILAAIAIPRFGQTRERAFISAMQSDLRQVMNSQELFYQTNNFTYADGVADGAADPPTNDTGLQFTPSTGVTVTITENGGLTVGYLAVAEHENAPGVTCDVFIGSEDAPGGTVSSAPGVIACDDTPA
jgi:prepilin-type N-terminal cleavage/methylation domain-containing protein